MAKRTSTRAGSRQAQKQYRAKIKKLQGAGLIGKIDTRKHASPATKRALEKYRGFLAGKESAVKASDAKTARELRRKFGFKGTGKTVIIPRERGERFQISKKGELTSVRPNPVEPKTKIKKTFGEKLARPPAPGDKLYYTLPERKRGLGRVKRHTFASFDEMLFYLNSYDINFDDIEDFIEIEEVVSGGARDTALSEKIRVERQRRAKKKLTTKKKRTIKNKRAAKKKRVIVKKKRATKKRRR